MEEKKKAYGDYRQARQEMQEILTVKANVDRLMGIEDADTEREKEHGQRCAGHVLKAFVERAATE